MSVEIKIPISGVTLNTKKKYVEEDITITPIVVKYNGEASEDVTPNEDGLITRTLTRYINNRVTTIGESAFRQWTTIEECDFQNVTVINRLAFYGCTKLKNILLPNVTTIGEQAFNGCSNLEKIKCDLVTTLGSQAIRGCKNLKYFYSTKLTSIQNGCFADCTNLVAIIISSDTVCPLSVTNAFNNTPIISGTGYIYVPDSLVDSYKSATNWSTYASQIKPISELPQEVKDELGIE